MKAKMPIADQDAFLQMVDENRGTLYKVCLMFSSRQSEELRDLYQEVCAACGRAMKASTDAAVRSLGSTVWL